VQKLQDQARNAVEDAETTRKGYMTQMDVLTEHISLQTQQLGNCIEELEKLKSHKVYCTKCKIWNSVGWLVTEGKDGQKCSKGNHGTNYNFPA
jgi:hypothetical protein